MSAPDKLKDHSFAYGQGRFKVTDPGVYYIGKDNDGQDKTQLFLSSRLDVTAKTRSEKRRMGAPAPRTGRR